jgi:hypothetical protein
MPACGEDNRFGMDGVQFACCQFHCHNASGLAIDHDEIKHLIFIKEIDLVLQALLVQGLQDHVSRAVGGVCRAADGFARFVVGMPAKRTLGNFAFGRAVEGQTHVFEFEHGVDGFIGHELDRVLVAEIIGTFDGIVHVPFGLSSS